MDINTKPSASAEGPKVERLRPAKARFERGMIRKALTRCQYNLTMTAAQLGISRHALRHRMRRLGINASVQHHQDEQALALPDELLEFERQAIIKALAVHNHDLFGTATALGLSQHALRYRMRRLNLHNGTTTSSPRSVKVLREGEARSIFSP